MKRILMLAVVLIGFTATACAPLLSTGQREQAKLSTDGTSVLFSNPAPTLAEDAVVMLYGPVTVSGAACIPFSKSWAPTGACRAGRATGCRSPGR